MSGSATTAVYRKAGVDHSDGIEISGELAAAMAEFVGVAEDELDGVIERALGTLGQALDMDLATVVVEDQECGSYRVVHQWLGPVVRDDPRFQGLKLKESHPWLQQQLEKREPFLISRLGDWPHEAKVERATCEQAGIKSVLWGR